MRLVLILAPWLLVAGSGGAGFSLTIVDVPDSPRRLDAADLDGDGDIDLFVVGRIDDDNGRLRVLLNDRGHFTPGWSLVEEASYAWEPGSVWDADLADTDYDGDADVVYVVPFGSPRERFNDGQAQFDASQAVPTYSCKFENELEDMDDDGNVDLVYYEPDFFGDSYFGTMKGLGNGSFAWYDELYLPADLEGHRRIALGDVTGDGLRDAAFTSLVSGLRIFRGKAPPAGSSLPGWYPPQVLYPKPCSDAAMVDLDGNGHLDLVASVPSLASVVVFLAGPTGQLGRPRRYPAGSWPDALAVADLDLDGLPDVIVADRAAAAVHVLRGTGNGALEPPESHDVGRDPTDVVVVDLDGDGDDDLAVTCAVERHVALLFNGRL